MDKTQIILLHETAGKSWKSDLGTFAMFAAMVIVSWFFDQPVFSTLAALFFIFWIISMALRGNSKGRMTIDEARAKIDEIEASQ